MLETMGRPLIGLVCALSLGGCAVFAPPYDPTLDSKITTAYEGVAKLAAEAEMGLYVDKATYPGKIETYADIQAALAVAAVRAATQPYAAKPAQKAIDAEVSLIKGCSAQVQGLAQLHQLQGIVPNTGATTAMMVSCDQAAKAVTAMK
ncbi:hypothetical protein [Caulobacter radicis]|uniref:Uncharacterized protein n=1 Tax=Caulobacter radicis TaxID=2172650 RepID=A0A2T9JD15_9CAUL|nr:hypothetical protein [Caulobacter radicis]PVM80118.1 hypothetical protein DDF65_14425 [Caulobacter radicis]